jgi:hypothetical protein
MGGPGSGNSYHWWRPSRKVVVEDCRELDANRWMRDGLLRADVWQSGSCRWFRDAQCKEEASSIGFEVNTLPGQAWVRLSYRFTATDDQVDYRVGLSATRPRFGGLRWWFVCPLAVDGVACGRRVGKLYLPPHGRYFGCRHCHRLTYTSCRESRKYDALAWRLAGSMGRDFAEVKRAIKRIGKGRG